MAWITERKNKRGDTVWHVTVCLGTDPETGKKRRKNFTVKSPRKKDAEKAAREILNSHDRGELPTTKTTVNALLDDLQADYRINGKRVDLAQ